MKTKVKNVAQIIYWIAWIILSIYFIATHPQLLADEDGRLSCDSLSIIGGFLGYMMVACFIGSIIAIPLFTRRER